jgi:hypothetical protein
MQKKNLLQLLLCALPLVGCAVTPTAPEAPAAVSAPAVKAEKVPSTTYARVGFVVFEDEGRLWIFRDSETKALKEFMQHGELVKSVSLPAIGPERKTIRGENRDTLLSYAHTKPGFVVFHDEGRLWIFQEGEKALAEFLEHGELVKMVVRPGAGPNRMTVRASDGAVIEAYMAAK